MSEKKRQRRESDPSSGDHAETAAGKPAAKKPAAKKPAAKPAQRRKPARRKPAAAAVPAAEPPVAKSAAKPSLPPFGFAEDLLRAAGGDADAADPAAVPAVDSSDPARIYAFADRLDAENRRRAERVEEVTPERLESWVTFGLESETYGLPVAPIQEVLRVAGITRVPHAPNPIRGVTQVRGRVIPVIDLGLRLGLDARQLSRASRVLVVASRRRVLGLLVDRVHQVAHIDLNRTQAPPDDVRTPQSDFVAGVYQLDERLVLLLDVDRVMIVHGASGAA